MPVGSNNGSTHQSGRLPSAVPDAGDHTHCFAGAGDPGDDLVLPSSGSALRADHMAGIDLRQSL
jgi:hypothetical protein